jgi:hypothetical protein
VDSHDTLLCRPFVILSIAKDPGGEPDRPFVRGPGASGSPQDDKDVVRIPSRLHGIQWAFLTLLVSIFTGPSVVRANPVRCIGGVVDAQGQPVGGAEVAVYEMVSDGVAGNIEVHRLGRTVTPANGRYVIDVEPNATRRFLEGYIVAQKEGLALDWTVWSMREDAEFTLELGAPEKLAGRIVDEAGRPVVGADVRAHLLRTVKAADAQEESQWLPGIGPMQALAARSNDQGAFVFANLPAHVGLDVLVTARGRAQTYTFQTESRESAFRAGQVDVKVTVPIEARIEGRILDPDTGQGVAGARFAVVATFSSLFYDRHVCTTDESGDFSLGGLKAGRYLIRADNLPNTLVEAESRETVRITICTNKLYYGRVLFDDGTPAVIKYGPGAGTEVDLVNQNGEEERRIGDLDGEGYFSVHLSDEQFRRAQTGEIRLEVCIGYREGTSMSETVTAVDLLATDKEEAGVARVPKPYVDPISLAGKMLPPLDQIGHAIDGDRTRDKALLVCFFDMNQRPSRNCLLQLSRKVGSFTGKGLVVLAVQTPKVEGITLDDWLEQSDISLPVGQIATADDERTRFTWGVKALPWLVLTDRNHIVTAEGISLDELGAAIHDNR